ETKRVSSTYLGKASRCFKAQRLSSHVQKSCRPCENCLPDSWLSRSKDSIEAGTFDISPVETGASLGASARNAVTRGPSLLTKWVFCQKSGSLPAFQSQRVVAGDPVLRVERQELGQSLLLASIEAHRTDTRR